MTHSPHHSSLGRAEQLRLYELIIAGGDRAHAAWERLAPAVSDALDRILGSHNGGQHDAEDVRQELLLTYSERMGDGRLFDGYDPARGNPVPWLAGQGRWRRYDAWRDRASRRRVELQEGHPAPGTGMHDDEAVRLPGLMDDGTTVRLHLPRRPRQEHIVALLQFADRVDASEDGYQWACTAAYRMFDRLSPAWWLQAQSRCTRHRSDLASEIVRCDDRIAALPGGGSDMRHRRDRLRIERALHPLNPTDLRLILGINQVFAHKLMQRYRAILPEVLGLDPSGDGGALSDTWPEQYGMAA